MIKIKDCKLIAKIPCTQLFPEMINKPNYRTNFSYDFYECEGITFWKMSDCGKLKPLNEYSADGKLKDRFEKWTFLNVKTERK